MLELGCGVGIALLCLGVRIPGLSLTGVEVHPLHADLARRNAARNDIGMRVVEADISVLPADLRNESFDLILANPPFFDRSRSTRSDEAGREAGRGETVPLELWIDIAAKRLAPKGKAVFLQHAARLPEIVSRMRDVLGSLQVVPIQPRSGQEARLILVQGIKNGRAAFRMRSPVTLHCSTTHGCSQDKYTPEIEAVLRQGAERPVF